MNIMYYVDTFAVQKTIIVIKNKLCIFLRETFEQPMMKMSLNIYTKAYRDEAVTFDIHGST